ncbi:MAG: SHOCT domain-containing protein [Spirochaetales bacterium]|nr:SHOCT domain-containing protein [Spirochaetales bacterium]
MAWFLLLGFSTMNILSTTFAVLLVIRLVAGFKAKHDPALKVLGNRFAAGEITEEEFSHRRLVLEGELPS